MGKRKTEGSSEAVKLLINGHLLNHGDIAECLEGLLGLISFKMCERFVSFGGNYGPQDVVRENIHKVFEAFIEYCDLKRMEYRGDEKAKITRLMRRVEGYRDRWSRIKNFDVLRSKFYDLVLSLQDLGTLHGFGEQKE